MTTERKTARISARLPAALLPRVDFVIRNTEGEIKNRSIAFQAALEFWLAAEEKKLETLGILSKKAR